MPYGAHAKTCRDFRNSAIPAAHRTRQPVRQTARWIGWVTRRHACVAMRAAKVELATTTETCLRTASRVSLRMFGETPKKARACGCRSVTPAIAYSPAIQTSARESVRIVVEHCGQHQSAGEQPGEGAHLTGTLGLVRCRKSCYRVLALRFVICKSRGAC
jgi:hypothetical protein